jgi:DNA-directed RNA polymerase subunit H
MVPRHEVLSEGETKTMLENLHTLPERLPKIYVQDPGLKTDPAFVKAREAGESMVGRLVRVRRPSETAGLAFAYRIIVSSSGGE